VVKKRFLTLHNLIYLYHRGIPLSLTPTPNKKTTETLGVHVNVPPKSKKGEGALECVLSTFFHSDFVSCISLPLPGYPSCPENPVTGSLRMQVNRTVACEQAPQWRKSTKINALVLALSFSSLSPRPESLFTGYQD